MKVPPLDLKAQFEPIRDEAMAAVAAVVESHAYCNGPAVRELEKALAAYCGCRHALGCSSGTDALLLSLMGLGIGGGDEVITTPFTFFATAGVIWRVGARPVFADIDPATFNIDPAAVEAAVTLRTKAIIPVHLYGQTADMDPLLGLARRRGLAVVEDAAQAMGARYKGRMAGTLGAVGCLSFYPTKSLNAMGDAGAVVLDEPDLARRLEHLRVHGESSRYHHKYVGGNFRMDSIQAAVLSVKLRRLDAWIARRREIAARYEALLAGSPARTPAVAPGREHSFNYYVIRAPRRDELREHLTRQEIATNIYYPRCLHQQECFAPLGYRAGQFPAAEAAAAESLALPMYPELADAQVEFVAEQVKRFY